VAIRIDGKHVVLVGMMGTGKTAVGRALATRLKRPFYDTDRLIEAREGRSIQAIFGASGEPYFRDVETTVIQQAVGKPVGVIAIGGGALLREENRSALSQRGVQVWLKADLDTMLTRTKGRSTRPLLNVQDRTAELARLLEERTPLYAKADMSVETTGKRVEEVTQMILNRIEGGDEMRQEGR
jgi:shikimate kinase